MNSEAPDHGSMLLPVLPLNEAGGATGGATGGPAYVIYKQRPRRRERKADLIFLRRDDVDILNTKIAITLDVEATQLFHLSKRCRCQQK